MEKFHLIWHEVPWMEAESSGPGGDDSSSGGGGDLGAAQNSLEVWTDTGNRGKGEPWS